MAKKDYSANDVPRSIQIFCIAWVNHLCILSPCEDRLIIPVHMGLERFPTMWINCQIYNCVEKDKLISCLCFRWIKTDQGKQILFFFLSFLLLFFYFWLRWVFIAMCRLSLVAASGGCSSLWCTGFSSQWLLLLWSTGPRRAGFSSCGTWAQ